MATRAQIAAGLGNLANQVFTGPLQQNVIPAGASGPGVRPTSNGRTFTRFNVNEDVIPNQQTVVTTGIFTNNAGSLTAVYTGSTTDTQKTYYYDIVDSSSISQFAVAYGDRVGSGSYSAGQLNDSPTRAIYSQYRSILLEPGDTQFTLENGRSTDRIYVINFNRARMKEKVDPGNWQLHLAALSGSGFANNVHTGSNVRILPGGPVLSLIDDSGGNLATVTTTAEVYNIVSGTINGGVYNSTAPSYYGLVYPQLGVLILDANMLDASASFNTVTGSAIAGDNAFKLVTSISGAIAQSPSTYAFQARNEQAISSTQYFVRVKNAEYNFSNNPTFVTGSVGQFKQPTFIGNPKVYVTTIGLYNDAQELLAVAKLSKPIQKNFGNELLVKVKLDF